MKKEKCYWCENFAIYGAFNMNKMPKDVKEDDVIPKDLLNRYACETHKDHLKLWME